MIQIFHYGGYRVHSHGNGAAYTLEAGGSETFIPYGDDAAIFRDRFNTCDAIDDPEHAINCKCGLIADYVLYR